MTKKDSSPKSNLQSSSKWGIYNKVKRGMNKLAMGGLSILVISAVYIFTHEVPLTVPIFVITFTFPAVGTIYGRDLENPRFGIYLRSSTDDDDHGASRSHQQQVQEREIERVGGEVVKVIDRVESGATVERNSLDEFAKLAREDEIDVLSVMDIDRLTRADPLEFAQYYRKLSQTGCYLYSRSTGYVDWDDLHDQQNLLNQTIFARKWYLRIQEGTAGSIESDLSDGKYPVGNTPFGYETDDDHEIWVRQEARETIYRAFDIYTRVKNRSKTREIINRRRSSQDKDKLSDSNLRTLLESRLCIGELSYDGNVVSTKSDLQVVDGETFHKAQEILRERRRTDNHDDLPKFVSRAAGRYGLDYITTILESLARCRKCGGELNPNGPTEIRDITLQSYKCTDCGYDGPILTDQEIQELHQTVVLSCPFCQTAERFNVSEVNGFDEYQYECKLCGKTFKAQAPPDKFARLSDHSDVMFDIEEDKEKSSTQTSTTLDSPESTDDDQAGLSKFMAT